MKNKLLKKYNSIVFSSLAVAFLVAGCSEQVGPSSAADSGSQAFTNSIVDGAGSNLMGAPAASSDCAKMSVGVGADLNGFVPFSSNNPWNLDVSEASADPHSADLISTYINQAGRNPSMRADLGSEYGSIYNVVDSSTQALQTINIDEYASESDVVPVPLPNWAAVQGGSQNCADGGDCHLFILDRSQCWLYEAWNTSFDGTHWRASNMAVWDLLGNSKRPYGWTSADAAGMSVFAGLIRYDEVARGEIHHAIRFTLKRTAPTFVAPATHKAGSDSASPFSMGTRFRLKADFDISGYSEADQVILRAMKKYGMILTDNGNDLEIAGVKDSHWKNSDVVGLQSVHLQDFEVMPAGPTYQNDRTPNGERASIESFQASSQSIARGESVTLNWVTSDDAWNLIDVVGPVRGDSITLKPAQTTTYTLNTTNAYGRSTQSITIEVH